MTNEIPRRARMDQWSVGERAIYEALQVVEGMGCDVRLTDAVVALSTARDAVADFVDGVGRELTGAEAAAAVSEALAGVGWRCGDRDCNALNGPAAKACNVCGLVRGVEPSPISDTDLIEFLEAANRKANYTGRVTFRWSADRGWRLHETAEGGYGTVREAIAAAIRQSTRAEAPAAPLEISITATEPQGLNEAIAALEQLRIELEPFDPDLRADIARGLLEAERAGERITYDVCCRLRALLIRADRVIAGGVGELERRYAVADRSAAEVERLRSLIEGHKAAEMKWERTFGALVGEDGVESAAAAVRKLQDVVLRCHVCDKPASCIGRYEGHGDFAPACDVCCGHGNEDGVCWPLGRAIKILSDRALAADDLEDQIYELRSSAQRPIPCIAVGVDVAASQSDTRRVEVVVMGQPTILHGWLLSVTLNGAKAELLRATGNVGGAREWEFRQIDGSLVDGSEFANQYIGQRLYLNPRAGVAGCSVQARGSRCSMHAFTASDRSVVDGVLDRLAASLLVDRERLAAVLSIELRQVADCLSGKAGVEPAVRPAGSALRAEPVPPAADPGVTPIVVPEPPLAAEPASPLNPSEFEGRWL